MTDNPMQQRTSHVFFNRPHRLARESAHQRIRWARDCVVPGYIGDETDRGQPKRFDRWAKLPEAAHRLFWRVRGAP